MDTTNLDTTEAPSNSAEFLSRVDAAAYLGITPGGLDKLRQRGRVRPRSRGQYARADLDAARAAQGAPRPGQALMQRAQVLARKAREKAVSGGAAADRKSLRGEGAAGTGSPSTASLESPKAIATAVSPEHLESAGTTILDLKVRHERAKAETAEIDLAVRRGQLVSAADVRRDANAAAVILRRSLQGLAHRLSPMLAVETTTAGCSALIEAEVRLALADFESNLQRLGSGDIEASADLLSPRKP